MARAAEIEAARVRKGLADPRANRPMTEARRPLGDHLGDYIKALAAKCGDPKHVRQTRTYGERVIEQAGIDRIEDLVPSAVHGALDKLRAQGLSARTQNAHITAIKSFGRWLRINHRVAEDSLAGVGKLSEKADRRHDRRTLGLDELHRLIDAATVGGPYRKMSGPARALCYRLAATTGLRHAEIKSLITRSFSLNTRPATVTVAAGYTKNGQTATQEITPDLIIDLRAYLAGLAEGSPAFPLPEKGAEMLRVDLAAEGIPYRDGAGRVFNFHALRCQFATMLDLAGVSPRIVQQKMRHSTPELTGRYTRPRDQEMEAATAALPDSARTGRPPMPFRPPLMSWNLDASEKTFPRICHAQGAERGGSWRRMAGPAAEVRSCRKPIAQERLDAARRDLAASGGSAPRRTRTYNPLIKSQQQEFHKPLPNNNIEIDPLKLAAHLPRGSHPPEIAPDLAAVIAAWDVLPGAIRAAIMAIVRSPRD